jgi:hypothetical protein
MGADWWICCARQALLTAVQYTALQTGRPLSISGSGRTNDPTPADCRAVQVSRRPGRRVQGPGSPNPRARSGAADGDGSPPPAGPLPAWACSPLHHAHQLY